MDNHQKALLQLLILKKPENKTSQKLSKVVGETLVKNLSVRDKSVNKSLATYVSNRKLIDSEDTMIEEIEKQLSLDNTEVTNNAETIKNKGNIKKILGQVLRFKKRNESFLKNYEKEKKKFSPKAQEAIRNIEQESGNKIKVVIDKDFTENFRSIMGISYRGGGILGQYVVVDNPKTLEDEDFLRHEAIHCAQQRDLGFNKPGVLGFIRWTAIGGISLLTKCAQIRGLDEDMDYGTDNQVTDYETYLNQFSKGYLATREPGAWKKYRSAEFRKQEMNRFKQEELQTLEDKMEKLHSFLKKNKTDNEKKEIMIEIKKLEFDIQQYKEVYENLKKMDEVLVVMIKPDIQGNKKEDTREQVYFESEKNRKIRLPIEKFIQKYGTKEDNYKQGTEIYITINNYLSQKDGKIGLFNSEVEELEGQIIHTHDLTKEQKKTLKKDIERIGSRKKRDSRKKSKQDRKALQAERDQMI